MYGENDRYQFEEAFNANARAGTVRRFPGMPVGIQLYADWTFISRDLGDRNDALCFVDSDVAPTAGSDGLEWEQDIISGGTPTLAVDVNGHPPFLSITTPASDGQGLALQCSVGTREMVDFATVQEAFLYGVFRLSDANNNAATLTQSQFAFGYGPIDTAPLTIDDYVGFYKADASAVIEAVCDDDSVALTASSNRINVIDLSTGNPSGGSMANRWFGLGLKLDLVNQSGNTGAMHTFYDGGRAGSDRVPSPTHRGSRNMTEVPDQPITPTIAFAAGEATAKVLSFSKIITATKYRLGVVGS